MAYKARPCYLFSVAMRLIYFLSFLLIGVSCDIVHCPPHVINITQQWDLPMTPVESNVFCTYKFVFPTDSYAVLSISTIDFASSDSIFIMDNFGDRIVMDKSHCSTHCHNMTSETRWPSNFSITVITGKKEGLQVQFSISLVPLNLTSNVKKLTTASDSRTKLVYFKDWKKETTYTVKSNTSKVYLQAGVVFKDDTYSETSKLNDVFVFDGGKNIGTLSHMYLLGYISQTNTVTLYATTKVDLRGAVLFTDFDNIRSLETYHVEYAPPYQPHNNVVTTEVVGTLYPSQEGAMTIISDEDDSEQVTIRELSNRGTGGVFSYKMNGPLKSHQDVVNPLGNSNLPQNFDGNMNTIYISQGAGDIKYSVFPND